VEQQVSKATLSVKIKLLYAMCCRSLSPIHVSIILLLGLIGVVCGYKGLCGDCDPRCDPSCRPVENLTRESENFATVMLRGRCYSFCVREHDF